MTRKFWTLFAATGAIAVSLLSQGPAQSQEVGTGTFYCGMAANGLPATIYRYADGATEPWIIWTSDFFTDAGYNPEVRCQEVSARMETYRRNAQLNYVALGRMNGEDVICASPVPTSLDRNCQNLIFTLKPGQNAIRTLNTFLARRAGEVGTPSLYESTGSQRTYIDVRSRFTRGSGSTPAPAPTQPVAPQPTQNPGTMRPL